MPDFEQHLTGDLKKEDAATAADILESLRAEFKVKYDDPSKVPPEKVRFALGQLEKLGKLYGGEKGEWQIGQLEKQPKFEYQTPDGSEILVCLGLNEQSSRASLTLSETGHMASLNLNNASIIQQTKMPIGNKIIDVCPRHQFDQLAYVDEDDWMNATYWNDSSIFKDTAGRRFANGGHYLHKGFSCFAEMANRGSLDGYKFYGTKTGDVYLGEDTECGNIDGLPVEKLLISKDFKIWAVSGNKVFYQQRGKDAEFIEVIKSDSRIVHTELYTAPDGRELAIFIGENGEYYHSQNHEKKENILTLPAGVKITSARYSTSFGMFFIGTSDGNVIVKNFWSKKMKRIKVSDSPIKNIKVNVNRRVDVDFESSVVDSVEVTVLSQGGKLSHYTFSESEWGEVMR